MPSAKKSPHKIRKFVLNVRKEQNKIVVIILNTFYSFFVRFPSFNHKKKVSYVMEININKNTRIGHMTHAIR